MTDPIKRTVDSIEYSNNKLGKHYTNIIFEGVFGIMSIIGIVGMVTFYRIDNETTNDTYEGED